MLDKIIKSPLPGHTYISMGNGKRQSKLVRYLLRDCLLATTKLYDEYSERLLIKPQANMEVHKNHITSPLQWKY